jgi:hypothetical protein
MKKQFKKLELKKDAILNFSKLQTIKGGLVSYTEDTLYVVVGTGMGGGPHLMTSVGMVCPTMVQATPNR